MAQSSEGLHGIACRLLICFVLVAIVSTACGLQATPTPAPRTIRFALASPGLAGETQAYSQVANAFHAANPLVTVQIKTYASM